MRRFLGNSCVKGELASQNDFKLSSTYQTISKVSDHKFLLKITISFAFCDFPRRLTHPQYVVFIHVSEVFTILVSIILWPSSALLIFCTCQILSYSWDLQSQK